MGDSCSICTGDYEPLRMPCPECGSTSIESEFVRRERDASEREFENDRLRAKVERYERALRFIADQQFRTGESWSDLARAALEGRDGA